MTPAPAPAGHCLPTCPTPAGLGRLFGEPSRPYIRVRRGAKRFPSVVSRCPGRRRFATIVNGVALTFGAPPDHGRLVVRTIGATARERCSRSPAIAGAMLMSSALENILIKSLGARGRVRSPGQKMSAIQRDVSGQTVRRRCVSACGRDRVLSLAACRRQRLASLHLIAVVAAVGLGSFAFQAVATPGAVLMLVP